MKKFFIMFILLAFVASLIGTAFAQNRIVSANRTPIQPVNDLVSLLPASDAVMRLDMERLMNNAVPAMMQTRPEILTQMNAKFDDIKNKTGIDLRQFQQVAVGVSYKKVSSVEMDYEPVVMARGKFDTAALTGAAKLAAKGKYREEKLGGRSVYIFPAKEVFESYRPQNGSAKTLNIFDMISKRLSGEIAMTSFDSNTLVIGKLPQLQSMIGETKSRVAPDLMNLVNRRPTAVMSFAMNLPEGASQFVKLDMDEIGKNLDQVRQAYGTMDFADNVGIVNLNAVAKTNDAAAGLEEMVKGMQMLGKVFLGNAQGADKQIYAKLVENAVISRQNTTVTIDLRVPQADINSLAGILIK